MVVKNFRLPTERLMPHMKEITDACIHTFLSHMAPLLMDKKSYPGTSLSTISTTVAVSFFANLVALDMEGYEEERLEKIFNQVKIAIKERIENEQK